MSSEVTITHEGIVEQVNTDSIKVRIIVQSACSACHSKGVCSVAGTQDKIIQVANSVRYNVKEGDTVKVSMVRSQGYTAVILGYLIPFLLLLTVLIVGSFFWDDLIAGLAALGVLVPYYLVLYLNRNKLQKKFDFRLQ